MLPDHRDWLRGRDVVARVPIVIPGGALEILFDDLFSPRKSVATAHWEIMADNVATHSDSNHVEIGCFPS